MLSLLEGGFRDAIWQRWREAGVDVDAILQRFRLREWELMQMSGLSTAAFRRECERTDAMLDEAQAEVAAVLPDDPDLWIFGAAKKWFADIIMPCEIQVWRARA